MGKEMSNTRGLVKNAKILTQDSQLKYLRVSIVALKGFYAGLPGEYALHQLLK